MGNSHPLHRSSAVRCRFHTLCPWTKTRFWACPSSLSLPLCLESYLPVTLRFPGSLLFGLRMPAGMALASIQVQLMFLLWPPGLRTAPPCVARGKCTSSWLVCLPPPAAGKPRGASAESYPLLQPFTPRGLARGGRFTGACRANS